MEGNVQRSPLNGTRKGKPSTRLAATAYHEAGHALANYVLGFGNGEVTIVPSKGASGTATMANRRRLLSLFRRIEYGTINNRVIASAHARVVCSLAGREAQRKFDPRSLRSHHFDSDKKNVADILSCLHPDEKELQAAYRDLVDRTRNLVADNWQKIQDLAAALLEKRTLSGGKVAAVFRASRKKLVDEG